jgi:hypothetical protein
MTAPLKRIRILRTLIYYYPHFKHFLIHCPLFLSLPLSPEKPFVIEEVETMPKNESKLRQLKNDLIIIIQYTQIPKANATYPLSEWMDGWMDGWTDRRLPTGDGVNQQTGVLTIIS